jgi:hypothetical protein
MPMACRAALVALLGLAACSQETKLRMMEQDGAFRVEPAGPGEYKVFVNNIRGVGWDVDDKAQRASAAVAYLRHQCPTARVVGEDVMATGTNALGRPLRTYVITVRC